MDGAETVVQDDVLLGHLARHVAAEVAVRDEQDVALRERGDDAHGVGGGHAHVGPRLDLRRRVDVAGHRQVVAVLLARGVHCLAADHVRHRAVRRRVGHEHGLVGREQLGALGHEADARKDERGGRQRGGQARQGEGVPHVVGQLLDLGRYVVVRQHHRAALALEARHLGAQLLCQHGYPLVALVSGPQYTPRFTADKTARAARLRLRRETPSYARAKVRVRLARRTSRRVYLRICGVELPYPRFCSSISRSSRRDWIARPRRGPTARPRPAEPVEAVWRLRPSGSPPRVRGIT